MEKETTVFSESQWWHFPLHMGNKHSIHLTCAIQKFVIIDKNNMIPNKTEDDSHDQSSPMKCQVRSEKPKTADSKNQLGWERPPRSSSPGFD